MPEDDERVNSIPAGGDLQFGEPHSYFFQMQTIDDLESVFASDSLNLLFLRDPWCPVSSNADEELYSCGFIVLTVDVSTRHDLSRFIEARTGIKHESPQAILLRDGTPVWHASHYAITSESVRRAMSVATSLAGQHGTIPE